MEAPALSSWNTLLAQSPTVPSCGDQVVNASLNKVRLSFIGKVEGNGEVIRVIAADTLQIREQRIKLAHLVQNQTRHD